VNGCPLTVNEVDVREKGDYSSYTQLVHKLVNLNVLEWDAKGRLIPRSLASSAKLLGSVEAGFPSPAEEELAETPSPLTTCSSRNPRPHSCSRCPAIPCAF